MRCVNRRTDAPNAVMAIRFSVGKNGGYGFRRRTLSADGDDVVDLIAHTLT
ncbi:hypothetical protein KCP73_13335 [Salmonella enterica subsp. enterica]|nr:hypothetical protein KCP73_13335 [Salmonella enterica subsp. enterica]